MDRNIENIMHIEEKKYNTGNQIIRFFRLNYDLPYLFCTECARKEIGNRKWELHIKPVDSDDTK